VKRKSEFNFNFRYFKNFNLENLKNKVLEFSNEWEINTSRQNLAYSDRTNPHINTNTYIVQDSSLDWNRGDVFEKVILDKEIFDLVYPIVSELENRMVGVSARILLIKLNANSKVFVHKDSGDYLSTVRRFHIPIITNENVSYTVGDEKIHMPEGSCYEINNLRLHNVDNDSDHDRIHLLIDIMPESEINTLESISPKLKIKLISNFIEKEHCDILVEYINKNYLDKSKFYIPKKAIENNRFKYTAGIPETHSFEDHKEIASILRLYSDKFISECNSFFKDEEELYLGQQWLTMLGAGTKLPPHYDDHSGVEHLFRSGVVYLNDDFDGGFLRFPDLNLTISTEKYSLVLFESHTLHEITQIIDGIRMTMPIWATNIKERGIQNG
jgi:hypothetical protein